MTQNQSNSIVKNPNTKKAVAVLKKYALLEAQLKAAEKEANEAKEALKQAMLDAGVDKIVLDPALTGGVGGYITLAERTDYKASDLEEVDDQFKRVALDADKVKAQYILTGELPEGVSVSKSRFITKKLKIEK